MEIDVSDESSELAVHRRVDQQIDCQFPGQPGLAPEYSTTLAPFSVKVSERQAP
jgi:hypothetical protein